MSEKPTASALVAAVNCEKNACHMEASALNERDNLSAYGQRLTALAYRQKALLLRGVSLNDIAAMMPSSFLLPELTP